MNRNRNITNYNIPNLLRLKQDCNCYFAFCKFIVSSFLKLSINNGIFKKALTLLYLLLIGTTLSGIVYASDIVIDAADATKAAQLTQTDKGIQQINIVNPQDGLSHNRFEKYSVDAKGIIINNSRLAGKVAGAGHVAANPNLTESAKTILFEVTGASRSELQGMTTIAGENAKFILTNPNGITCNGCEFVNSHEVELRTDKLFSVSNGQPNWETNPGGELDIAKGGIVIHEGSLLLSSGKIKIAGRVSVDNIFKAEAYYTDSNGSRSGKNDKTQKDKKQDPIYAIDISTIAPISAGKIYIVATGEGTGVKIATLKTIIDEEGKSSAAMKATKDDIIIKSQEGIEVQGSMYAKERLIFNSKDAVFIDANLIGSKGVSFTIENQLYGASSYVISDGDLLIRANSFKDEANKYDIGGKVNIWATNMTSKLGNVSTKGQIKLYLDQYENILSKLASDGYIEIKAKDTVHIKGGELFAKDKVIVSTNHFNLTGILQDTDKESFVYSGKILGQNIEINAQKELLNDKGIIKADKEIVLFSPQISNYGGAIDKNKAEIKFWLGNIIAGTDISLTSSNLINNQGLIESGKKLILDGNNLKNYGLINSGEGVIYKLNQEANNSIGLENKGTLSTAAKMYINLKVDDALTPAIIKIDNDGYLIGKGIEIITNSFENKGRVYSSENFELKVNKDCFNKNGIINVENMFKVQGGSFITEGASSKIIAGIADIVTSEDLMIREGEELIGRYGLSLSGKKVSVLGEVKSFLMQVKAMEGFINKGKIIVQKGFDFNGKDFENRGKIEVGIKSLQEFWPEIEVAVSDDKKISESPYFLATVSNSFKNLNVTNVGRKISNKEEGVIVITKDDNAKVENTGRLSANQINIKGTDIKLASGEIDLPGEDSGLYLEARDNIDIGGFLSSNEKQTDKLEINAHRYVFKTKQFLLGGNVILKDKGILEGDKGLFITAEKIQCAPSSVLDISGRIKFDTIYEDQAEIITGKISGQPRFWLNTTGIHRATNQIDVSELTYFGRIKALILDNRAKINVQELSTIKAQKDTIWESICHGFSNLFRSPIKSVLYIKADSIRFNQDATLNSSYSILLQPTQLEMSDGSKITSQKSLKVESNQVLGGGTFEADDNVHLHTLAGNIGSKGSCNISAKGEILLNAGDSILLSSLYTPKDISLHAKNDVLINEISGNTNENTTDVFGYSTLGNVEVYANRNIDIKAIHNVNKVKAKGEGTISLGLDRVHETEVYGQKIKQSVPNVQGDIRPEDLESVAIFDAKYPIKITGNFFFIGKDFNNQNIFKPGGDTVLVLDGDFNNNVNSEFLPQKDLSIIVKGFTNQGIMDIKDNFQLTGDYLINEGKISANAIKFYLTGVGPRGKSLELRSDGVLEAK